ncbi:hypothetical protein KCU62_g296, partial [Aureobasidium sp. EXF-3399]
MSDGKARQKCQASIDLQIGLDIVSSLFLNVSVIDASGFQSADRFAALLIARERRQPRHKAYGVTAMLTSVDLVSSMHHGLDSNQRPPDPGESVLCERAYKATVWGIGAYKGRWKEQGDGDKV